MQWFHRFIGFTASNWEARVLTSRSLVSCPDPFISYAEKGSGETRLPGVLIGQREALALHHEREPPQFNMVPLQYLSLFAIAILAVATTVFSAVQPNRAYEWWRPGQEYRNTIHLNRGRRHTSVPLLPGI